MKPMIDQAFWSDPDIEGAKPGVKLTALWLITNSQTNLLGICGASEGRFIFETGLDAKALPSTLEALPRAFVKVGQLIFIRNYIRHQFGSGEKLKRNNFFVALKSLFLSIKDEELRLIVLQEYPEFNEALQRASEGLTKPQYVKDRKDKEEGVQGKKQSKVPEMGTDEYFEYLKSNPAYAQRDVRTEYHKCLAYFPGQIVSHRRVLNWLNREIPSVKSANGSDHKPRTVEVRL